MNSLFNLKIFNTNKFLTTDRNFELIFLCYAQPSISIVRWKVSSYLYLNTLIATSPREKAVKIVSSTNGFLMHSRYPFHYPFSRSRNNAAMIIFLMRRPQKKKMMIISQF